MSNRFINPSNWGSIRWSDINFIIAGLPDILDDNMAKSVQLHYENMQYTLPCESCRKSYSGFMREIDTNVLDINNFKSRDSIISLNFNLRNKVNKKLGMNYYITLNYYKLKLNLLVCSGDNSLDRLMANLIEAPFIPDQYLEKSLKFIEKNQQYIKNYRKEDTVELMQNMKNFISNVKATDLNTNNPLFNIWIKRNKKCRDIINDFLGYITLNNCKPNIAFVNNVESMTKLLYLGSYCFSEEIFKTLI